MQTTTNELAVKQIDVTDMTYTPRSASLPSDLLADESATKIVLSTINAKYIHASLGLRYLYANLQELQSDCEIKEFVIQTRASDIVERILESKPQIVGFGVYIWNIIETTNVVSLLKVIAPDIKIVLGGPEVSYESQGQSIVDTADYVLTGPADISFYQLCIDILNDTPPAQKILQSKPVVLDELSLPYEYYSDEDLTNRLLYVEASRGCPFKCEFCLSSLDTSSNPFELQQFLDEMETLYQRGARNFKFIDRTFNLNIKTTMQIMQFFLDKMREPLFLHFEVSI